MGEQRIFIVEDDTKIASLLSDTLRKYHYQVETAKDFDRILEEFAAFDPHLILLDINLPSYDGYYWCRQLRQQTTCPILFISARSGEMDQVFALENGGDDFITKPFHYEIVLAKIRSHLRRAYGEYAPKQEERTVRAGRLVLYMERLELHCRETEIPLQKKESTILELLIAAYPKVVTREQLLEELWDDQAFVDENTLNVNMARVRKKLTDYGIQSFIETVRGAGYRLILGREEQ
ncbi:MULTISPECIES: response regulator transcription factor [unclassified Planococcus (in: firmicutes)]|uniref:response regulator transcription factor n=1 Tax=unclassified Planococcus (in: firmicutes) TaxID=2662419 RepID=UPI000C31E039|nr:MULTISPECIES: response regulator transcription factor [unclassified Planococcus (in: firmicutes)]AUD13442.1 DNA-binding response regulator [Planococcus sp. MB-3u-03]PKG46149.1 DNA-binding response regulator [Planococcus sp. Urea-trap-24]PKG89862.1 DNA-binding response regulator [Planococcus sp. Urea-3u-39]PKH43948.1 DNA-binding response regulator [Planococcus sp. MB-3u-09]